MDIIICEGESGKSGKLMASWKLCKLNLTTWANSCLGRPVMNRCIIHNVVFSYCKEWFQTSEQWCSCYLLTCNSSSDATYWWSILTNSLHLLLLLLSTKVRDVSGNFVLSGEW